MITRYQPGGHTLGLKCTAEELNMIVLDTIGKYERKFSFKQLLDAICHEVAKRELFQTENGVRYEDGYRLSPIDIDKVNKIVWDMIWDRKLMLELCNGDDGYTTSITSARLIKVK